jgi:hypothetical protein
VQAPNTIRVSEQNYEENLITQSALLQKYIDQQVEVIADFGEQSKRVSGKLLSATGGNMIVLTSLGVVIVTKVSAIDLASIP